MSAERFVVVLSGSFWVEGEFKLAVPVKVVAGAGDHHRDRALPGLCCNISRMSCNFVGNPLRTSSAFGSPNVLLASRSRALLPYHPASAARLLT